MPDPLVDSPLLATMWLSKLSRVSAKLYEIHIDVWERFEPQRKHLEETLSFLEYEGELDLRQATAAEAIRVLSEWNPARGAEWRSVATMVARVLDTQLPLIFASEPDSRGA